ncbi:cell wall-binding protein [Clostridium chromiireducens]|uniref:Cell wall-binding protein n=1 Tax=Clostridium chromiireducens TaxID=225345 RepID=A0A964W1P9_9CLOT|nr:cadherin-like beta sandwich domain-containing protein [Clostridium chromiireducens]MVX63292.1 cell wall-binding protein [Clostridium chromiireducens]
MKKNVKKIIAIALTISAFSAVVPVTSLDLMTTKAYASTGDLTSVKLKTSSGSNTIKTYSDDDYKSKHEIDDNDFVSGDTYYAKTSSKKVKISADGVNSSLIRVFKGTSSSSKGIKISSSIDLSSNSTTLTIRTYSEDPGSNIKYSDTSKKVSEYKIKVKCTSSSSSDDDDDNDNVYLKSISLSDGTLNFSKSTTTYNVNVSDSVKEIKITAKPDCDSDEYDDYDVKIDGTTVDEDDKFKKSVSLNKGKNEIKITVEDNEDNKKTYTLNITRANSSTNNTNTNANSGNTNTPMPTITVKTNQWVLLNGRWQYNDSIGIPLKSQWFFDRNLSKWYHLGSDGNMQTGWILDGGKYYYLYPDGSMAANTKIGSYSVGSNGAWIK